MLRCTPSRITLTSSDVAGLEQRLAARHSARLSKQRVSNVRLSRGPHRPTRLSIVSAEDNPGRKRAESSSSEATFHDESNNQPDVGIATSNDNVTPDVPTPKKVQEAVKDQSAHCGDSNGVLQNMAVPTTSPPKSSSCQQEEGSSTKYDSTPRQNEGDPQSWVTSALDGTFEAPAEHTFVYATPSMPFTRRGNIVLGEIQSDAYPILDRHTADPLLDRRLLSSARARRPHTRSHDIGLQGDPDELQEVLTFAQVERPFSQATAPTPDVTLRHGITRSLHIPALDPGAPVFVPRTRFGSAGRSSAESVVAKTLEPHWGSLDSTHNASYLRIRSTSEQNVETQSRQPRPSGHQTTVLNPELVPSQSRAITHQRRSRRVDQNTAIIQSTPDLERYPPLRPSSSLSSNRRTSTPFHSSHSEAHDVSQWHPTAGQTVLPGSTSDTRQFHLRVQPVFINGSNDMVGFAPQTRSASPSISTTSRSTPNLLSLPIAVPRISSRRSSRSWVQRRPNPPSSSRVLSMVSAASGISGDDPAPQSARKDLDAAEEFFRRRNSPLDELTERFSRMRSVGRSWEKTPGRRSRPSLLNGDPFGQAPPLPAQVSSRPASKHPSHKPEHDKVEEEFEGDPIVPDPVALSLALPPSSPLTSSSQILPCTPPLPGTFPTSPRSPLIQRSPTKSFASPETLIKRKPVPHTKTPKIDVYNDSQPSHTQPQTPADLARSRRVKTRDDTASQQSPIMVGRAVIDSPPPIPESHMHRSTVHSIIAPQAHTQAAAASTITLGAVAPPSTSQSTRRQRTRRRTQSQHTSEHVENDLLEQLPGLEEDRRTWLNRREAGTLDVTPPKEGRFEQFLS